MGNGYTLNANPNASYSIASLSPFYISEFATSPDHRALKEKVAAAFAEPGSTSFQYFQLVVPSAVTVTGSFKLFNMLTETEVAGFSSGNTLQPDYYKILATQPAALNAVNTVTVTYTNKYTDVSFNFYNQLGQTLASITPNGSKILIPSDLSAYTTASQLPFITLYQYDLQGRLTSSTSPDGGAAQYIYRQDGKIRFSQNAYQKVAANAGTGKVERFSYTDYDDYGRPVESGEYAVATATFSTLATNTTLLEATGAAGDIAGATKLSVISTHYDLPSPTAPFTGYAQDAGFLKGTVSYISNDNSTTWYNYDDHGRVSWMVKQIAGLGSKTVNYTYNDQGNVASVDFQRETPGERFIHYYTYDADSRLINAQTSTDGVTMVQQAHYYYYLHGPLKRVELSDQLQGIDYVYTPQGWLKSINSPTGLATNDPMKLPTVSQKMHSACSWNILMVITAVPAAGSQAYLPAAPPIITVMSRA